MNVAKVKKKSKPTVSISKKDLLKLLIDNEHYEKQVLELQIRKNELLLENKNLKKTLEETRFIAMPMDIHPDLEEQIYFDTPYISDAGK
jgi:hypothetical protein